MDKTKMFQTDSRAEITIFGFKSAILNNSSFSLYFFVCFNNCSIIFKLIGL